MVEDRHEIVTAVDLFMRCRVAIVVVTRGSKGSFVCRHNVERFKRSTARLPSWVDCTCTVGYVQLAEDAVLNGNGVGDSFTAGWLVNLESAAQFANLIAAYHVDVTTRDRSHIDENQLIDLTMIVISNRLEEI